jgi:nucleoside-diphosphate-sugar epimerase
MSLKKFQFIKEDLNQLFKSADPQKLKSLNHKKIFISGCSGFAGLWLCEIINYLIEVEKMDIKVYGIDIQLDRLNTQAPHLLNSKAFEFKKEDVQFLSDLPKDVNYVIHCAGYPDHRFHSTNPVDVLTSMALGTERILRAADRLSELQMFVNLSSGLVYGDFESRTVPLKESDKLSVKSNASYVSAKIFSEALTQSFRQQHRLPAMILRPFTFTGPFQSLTSPWALNNFIQDALSGSSIKVLGTGQTTRSFLYGTDVGYWILRMMIDGQSGDIFNLGSSEALELKQAANFVRQMFTGSKEIIYCAGNASHQKMNMMVPDNTIVESKFDLKPTYSAEKAIQRSVEWYQLESYQG